MNEYMKIQAEFEDRHDALCESTSPAECDCAACPAREMCEYLCQNEPFEETK